MFGGGDAPPPAAGMGSGTHARGAASTSEHDEALRAAASRGDVDGVRDALAVGADINHVDSRGKTALHHAALGNHIDTVKELANCGASLNAADRCGATPLHDASLSGHLSVVNLLLDLGASISARKSNGCSALHEAAWFGWPEILSELLKRGAVPDEFNFNEETPIALARKHMNDKCVDVLEAHLRQLEKERYDAEVARREQQWKQLRVAAADRERSCGKTTLSPRRSRSPTRARAHGGAGGRATVRPNLSV